MDSAHMREEVGVEMQSKTWRRWPPDAERMSSIKVGEEWSKTWSAPRAFRRGKLCGEEVVMTSRLELEWGWGG